MNYLDVYNVHGDLRNSFDIFFDDTEVPSEYVAVTDSFIYLETRSFAASFAEAPFVLAIYDDDVRKTVEYDICAIKKEFKGSVTGTHYLYLYRDK